ncbi:hypothetical protein PInf_025059 [Phytophthora infestans]|nr:hypothetical protein PInf_025059 [Phytophthora infestans]
MDFYGEEGSETEEGRYEGDSGDGEREEGPTSEQTERLYDWLLAEKRAEVVHVEIDCLEKAARECAEDAAEETAAEPVWSKATFKTNVKTKPDIKKEYGEGMCVLATYGGDPPGCGGGAKDSLTWITTTHDYYFGSRQ